MNEDTPNQKNPDQPPQMRTGYTTGTCAAAAAKAATMALIQGIDCITINVTLPMGKIAEIKIHRIQKQENFASAEVIKDGGDDPDVTNGAIIRAEVRYNSSGEIHIDGGIGVGRVTKPGLPVTIGQAAINPVPRKMIDHEVREILDHANPKSGIDVIISVPEGEKIAEQTMNSRLGIIGGISILGTRGIVIPFSTAAYRSTLAVTIKASAENGLKHLVLTTGGRSEKYARQIYPELDAMAFHEAGEFIGFALKKCVSYGIRKATIAGMMGKLSKVASGELMLHSSKSSVDFPFLAQIAKDSGADSETLGLILAANTANHVGEIVIQKKLDGFFDNLMDHVCKVCSAKTNGRIDIEVLLYTLEGNLLSRKIMPASSTN